jgi:hypothetical protein
MEMERLVLLGLQVLEILAAAAAAMAGAPTGQHLLVATIRRVLVVAALILPGAMAAAAAGVGRVLLGLLVVRGLIY